MRQFQSPTATIYSVKQAPNSAALSTYTGTLHDIKAMFWTLLNCTEVFNRKLYPESYCLLMCSISIFMTYTASLVTDEARADSHQQQAV